MTHQDPNPYRAPRVQDVGPGEQIVGQGSRWSAVFGLSGFAFIFFSAILNPFRPLIVRDFNLTIGQTKLSFGLDSIGFVVGCCLLAAAYMTRRR